MHCNGPSNASKRLDLENRPSGPSDRADTPVADGRYGARSFVTVDDLLHYVALAAVCWRAAKMRGAL
jgi:hypothetical protein